MWYICSDVIIYVVIEYFDLDLLFVISFLRIRLFLIKYNDHCDKYQYLLSIILKIENEFKNHLLIGCMPSHFWSYFPLKICEKNMSTKYSIMKKQNINTLFCPCANFSSVLRCQTLNSLRHAIGMDILFTGPYILKVCQS